MPLFGAALIELARYPETAEMLDSDKILVISDPPGTENRLFGAFPRSAEVDRLVGEIDSPEEAE